MPKYRMSYTVSSGKGEAEKKARLITRADDELAKKTYIKFCENANAQGIDTIVHPMGLSRLEAGGKEVEIKID